MQSIGPRRLYLQHSQWLINNWNYWRGCTAATIYKLLQWIYYFPLSQLLVVWVFCVCKAPFAGGRYLGSVYSCPAWLHLSIWCILRWPWFVYFVCYLSISNILNLHVSSWTIWINSSTSLTLCEKQKAERMKINLFCNCSFRFEIV